MTIRTRLALLYGGFVTVTIIILSLAVIGVSRLSILNTIDQLLNQTAAEVIQGINVIPVGQFGSLRHRVVFNSDQIFNAPGLSIQVWQTDDGTGPITPQLVRSSLDLANLARALNPDAMSATTPTFHTTELNGVLGRVATRPFFSSGDGRQIGLIQIAASLQPLEHANEVFLIITVVTATISIFVSMAVSMVLSSRMLRPVERITEAASSIADADDLSTRLPWDGPQDELGKLVTVFNHMMERLEGLFRVQQRFVSDVSHELRTPLTSILGNLEIMDRYGVDKPSMEAVHREAARMSRMVNDLLLLARADYGEVKVDLYPLDLDGVVLEVYEQAHVLAKSRDLKLKLSGLEASRVMGSTDRLKQLLLNLIGNAIKFTPDGGTITIGVRQRAGQAEVEVSDTGIGINAEDQKRIFDRFFQSDHSRTHRSENDGAGLGLSIARWIVSVHLGEIEVESAEGEGTTFRVLLPLLKEEAQGPGSNGKQPTGRFKPAPRAVSAELSETQNR